MLLLIGDIQGCDAALQRVLDAAGFSASRDRLVLLGDLVNRGPDSLATLRRLQALGSDASCLLGNHDLHLLAVAVGARALQRGDTLGPVLAAHDQPALLDWLRHQHLALQAEDWLCVHAGVLPAWSRTQTLALASEVQEALRGPGMADFLRGMSGNQPDRWHDSLRGVERARVIVNALTRLRFCSADGVMDLKTKEGAGAAPAGLMPWFDVPGRATAGQAMAFGHWSTLGLINRADLLALDTGCVWGGQLSAARVDGGRREILQVPCPQAQKPGV
jgi:bis(5'-nucleosyl)-tetraphosphatase (symmetrical)